MATEQSQRPDLKLAPEMGDVLFALVNLSRHVRLDAEGSLRRTIDKFTRRFSAMEARLRATGKPLSGFTLQEMEAEWGRIKQAERDAPTGGAPAPSAGL